MVSHHLACDLGAESGRLMLGTLEDDHLRLSEVHRFPNNPIQKEDHWHWDIARLFDEILVGLRKAAGLDLVISSISADSWGVDYVLFDKEGLVLPPAFHYRDTRTAEGVKKVWSKTDWPTLFAETGIQFMPINTVFQLAAEDPSRLMSADRLLNIGDAFNFLLSGVARAEQSLASTTQLFNPRSRSWSGRLIEMLGLPVKLFPELVPSGIRLGPMRPEVLRESGLRGSPDVIATCSHDTSAAVAAVPVDDNDGSGWAYLSSGTWSLLGVELPGPVISDRSREANFTNEFGYGGTVRFLKNIIGLWIVQECRRRWARAGRELDYDTLTRMAESAPPFGPLINAADARFMSPGDMPEKIVSFCQETGQKPPADEGAMIRCVLESLALLYKLTLEQLEQLTGKPISRLHVVGGGARNSLLNRFIASATAIPVIAGPIEASASGNILIQAIVYGRLPSLAAARSVVRSSTTIERIEPRAPADWSAPCSRLRKLLGRN